MEYRTVADFLRDHFPGKVQKVGIDAGLGCPGRCTYCCNTSFTPSYATGRITRQLDQGIRFFENKGPFYGYLAYFQSYTGTYGPLDKLVALYSEALSHPDILGLVIATRPDCLDPVLLDWFQHNFGGPGQPFLLVELGMESTNDSTLERIHRGHDWQCSVNAVNELHRRGIPTGAHLIIGLPGETDADFMLHAERLSELPISTLKLHQLQIIRNTPLAREYGQEPFPLLEAGQYADIVARFLKRLRKDIALDRFVSEAPQDMVIAPRWGLKPSQFKDLLDAAILSNETETKHT